jgi:hypothetical protein
MAKNSVRDFDATAANNTDIQSVDIAENCAPSGINNAIRELMADVKDVSTGTIALESPQADSLTVTGDLTVDTNTLYVDSTNNLVGIGLTNPSSYYAENLVVAGADEGGITIESGSTEKTYLMFARGTSGQDAYRGYIGYDHNDDSLNVVSSGYMNFFSGSSQIERMRIDSSGNVGIGTTSPSTVSGFTVLEVAGSSNGGFIQVTDGTVNNSFYNSGTVGYIGTQTNHDFGFVANGSERMRIDSSGNLLVGKTTSNLSTAGLEVDGNNNRIYVTRDAARPMSLNRLTNDGEILGFFKDGTTVGSIGSRSGVVTFIVLDPRSGGSGLSASGRAILPANENGATVDNTIDLGDGGSRFDDIFATNTTIQTSDQNEKQQIASLTDAEITAAKAISKLFKTFKWNDSVESKGDNARTHTGHIAQEVQQAMTDAGLDAADYAFWCSNTWWEHDVEVPAVEAVAEVLDDDGNVVTEAVEAQDAYTRTDIYNTVDEAPAGATERTRLGLRYAELLAFIGAATEQRLTDIETQNASLEARIVALENA